MDCIQSKIGVKGLCNSEANILLDYYGISLKKIANVAPASVGLGAEFLTALIDDSTKETLSKLRFDGMEIGRIVSGLNLGKVTNEDLAFAGYKYLTFNTTCIGTAFYIDSINIHGVGDVLLKINDEVLELGAVDGMKTFKLNKWIYSDTFTISINGDDFIAKKLDYSYCDCTTNNFTFDNSFSYGLQINMSLRCDLTNYFCQFADLIADVVKFKVIAKVLHTLKYSDRLNDFILFKDDDKIYELMSFYDSDFNLSVINGEIQGKAPKGQFQIAFESLNIPKPDCNCCKKICKDSVTFQLTRL